MELKKIRVVSSSSTGLLSADTKAYFDDWFGKILVYNEVRYERNLGCIEVVAKEAEKR